MSAQITMGRANHVSKLPDSTLNVAHASCKQGLAVSKSRYQTGSIKRDVCKRTAIKFIVITLPPPSLSLPQVDMMTAYTNTPVK